MSNKNLPLQLGQTYLLEDIYKLNPTALNKICWLFDVSGWVGNVPKLLREAICHIPRFAAVYNDLNNDSKIVLIFLCKYDGRPVPINEVYENLVGKMATKVLDAAIANLIEGGWVLEGIGPRTLWTLTEFKKLIAIIPAFQEFLQAELPQEQQATVIGGQYLADLLEIAAFIHVEKPKLTVKGFISKTILRRLVSRLSPIATDGWEELATESVYTNYIRTLLAGLQAINALQLVVDKVDNRAYHLNTEKWDDFIFSPAANRLMVILGWHLIRINMTKRGSIPFVASILENASQMQGRWQTSAYLMSMSSVPESTVEYVHQDPFNSEDWLEEIVLEPLLYLGIFEKTIKELPAPWLGDKQLTRIFWRLTPLGLGLAEWLVAEKDNNKAMGKIMNADIADKDLTATFSLLFDKWQNLLPAELEQQLIIQPDLSFFVTRSAPPYLLWILSVFGTTQIQEYVYQGSFSRESVFRALKGGVPINELFIAIKDHSKVPPAENVMQALQQWAAAYDRTIFSRVTVLSCDTPEITAEIAAQSKLTKFVIGQIGPQTLLIQPGGESTIRKWLEKKNWVPRPGVVDGEILQQWLNKIED